MMHMQDFFLILFIKAYVVGNYSNQMSTHKICFYKTVDKSTLAVIWSHKHFLTVCLQGSVFLVFFLHELLYIQSNFDGSNIFGAIENCSRHGWFEPLRVSYDAKSGEANGDNLGIFSIFYTIIVCWVYSLELPRWGNSNEYTQHTISR